MPDTATTKEGDGGTGGREDLVALTTEDLLSRLIEAQGAEEAQARLLDLLQALQRRPIRCQTREKIKNLGATFQQEGWMRADDPLMRALTDRVSPAFLPGVTLLDLPSPPEADIIEPSIPLEGEAAISTVPSAPNQLPPPPINVGSDDEGLAEGGVTLGSEEDRLQQLLMTPVPAGGKMMCTITRHTNTLKACYRLYLETVELPDEQAVASFRAEIESKRYPIDPSSVVVTSDWQEGEEEDDCVQEVRTPVGGSSSGPSRMLVEAKRNKGAKTFQLAMYAACPKTPTKRSVLGRLERPSVNFLTASGCGQNTEGSRACVKIVERERDKLLSLTAVIPCSGPSNIDASMVEQLDLEASLAYLQAICSDMVMAMHQQGSSKMMNVFALRNRMPRWSTWQGLHTLEFEGRDRVVEPSRKNMALLDLRDAGPATEGDEAGGRTEWVTMRKTGAILLQLGKKGEDKFSLDFRSPLSPFQAMAIAVAAFES